MRTNSPQPRQPAPATHEGGKGRAVPTAQQLVRQVATCMLFENTFYESRDEQAENLAKTCQAAVPRDIATVARMARNDFKLRHVPLFLVAQLVERQRALAKQLRNTPPDYTLDPQDPVRPWFAINSAVETLAELTRQTILDVVQRPDEMGELLAILQRVSGAPTVKKALTHSAQRGLAGCFHKFDEYKLAKWDRDAAIKLRDVMFLVHPKPETAVEKELFRKIANRELQTPDTWEVALSAGKDKKETWERLLRGGNLGYMALLMNLRNMEQVGVERKLVERALVQGAVHSRALPYRFVAAAKAAPGYADVLSAAMVQSLADQPPLEGLTYLLVDVSGSMDAAVTAKSTITRWEAAGALGVLLRESAPSTRVYTFSEKLVEVPNLRGLGLVQGIAASQPNMGTLLRGAVQVLFAERPKPDRLIVVTDEQSQDGNAVLLPGVSGWIVNVAGYTPSVSLAGGWKHISGWSERIVDFIRWDEAQPQGE